MWLVDRESLESLSLPQCSVLPSPLLQNIINIISLVPSSSFKTTMADFRQVIFNHFELL